MIYFFIFFTDPILMSFKLNDTFSILISGVSRLSMHNHKKHTQTTLISRPRDRIIYANRMRTKVHQCTPYARIMVYTHKTTTTEQNTPRYTILGNFRHLTNFNARAYMDGWMNYVFCALLAQRNDTNGVVFWKSVVHHTHFDNCVSRLCVCLSAVQYLFGALYFLGRRGMGANASECANRIRFALSAFCLYT